MINMRLLSSFGRYLEKKDKSILIGQLIGLFLLVLVIPIIIKKEPDSVLGFSIYVAGIATGWAVGIIISPQNEFNNEGTKFTKVQQVIVSFITGALAIKFLPLLTETNIKGGFKDYLFLSRVMYFSASFILSGIIIYYDRVYLNDQDKAKLSFRRREMLPNSIVKIPINGIDPTLSIKFYNRGVGVLSLQREEDAVAENGSNSKPEPVNAGECKVFLISALGSTGNVINVKNEENKVGHFKLRIS